MIANRSKEIQTIDELIRTTEEKKKICEFNSKGILKLAKETKRLEEFDEEMSEKTIDINLKSDSKSDLLNKTVRSNSE